MLTSADTTARRNRQVAAAMRSCRARQRQGVAVIKITADEFALVSALVDARRRKEWDSECPKNAAGAALWRKQLAADVAALVADWIASVIDNGKDLVPHVKLCAKTNGVGNVGKNTVG